MKDCDLCGKPVLDGQPRFGGRGTGDKAGPDLDHNRHYDCHVAKFGRSRNLGLQSALRDIKDAFGTPPKEPLRDGPKPVKRSLVPADGSEYNRSENAGRVWRRLRRIDAVGKSKVEIECPFCWQRFWAFIWSLSGGGKKCPNCGAKHGSFGTAYPLIGNEDL